MLPSMRILLLSGLSLLSAVATGAISANAASEDDAKALAEAVAACDEGASAPLDPTARMRPVQFSELYPLDFDMTKVKALQSRCQQAWAGMPKEKRLQLQWLRVTVLLNEPGIEWAIPMIRQLADTGSAEAQYLLLQLYISHRREADAGKFPVQRDEALAALKAAAEKGHLPALQDLMWQYREGPLLRRDPQKAVQMARRIESAPPQGIAETQYDVQAKAQIPAIIATITLEEDGFSEKDQRMAFRLAEDMARTDVSQSRPITLSYIAALRRGRGTPKDVAKARELLETRVAVDEYAIPMLADMIARGEGGPADPRRALAMLSDERLKYAGDAGKALAGLLLDRKVMGRQPLAAIAALQKANDLDSALRLAGLLVDYHSSIDYPDMLIEKLQDGARAGEPGAGMALARLKLSGNSQFFDINGARALLKPLADKGDREALWLYAASQYGNEHSITSIAGLQDPGLSEPEVRKLIEEGLGKKEPQAYLFYANLLRRGVIYPQDDQAATQALASAANLGNVEAMVLLGDAYDGGLGTARNPRERLKAWRSAARLGSLEARKKLADAFKFDSLNKLMTLEEGVTGGLVLFINGYGRSFSGMGAGGDNLAKVQLGSMFSFGGRAMEGGRTAVAEAVMNAFREAPGGLEDDMLVSIGKALPEEIHIAIEEKLRSEGFVSGNPDGRFGPDVRKALADWVRAKGPLDTTAEPVTAQEKPPASERAEDIAPDMLARLRDSAYADATAAKSDRQKLTALSALNALARYGDLDARWGLLRNYHQAKVVRKTVTAAEITRYGLDILVARPEGMDKAEFEFIFAVSQIFQDGAIGEFGDAVLAAIRDDARLRDPLTLGGIMKHFSFAPGACDAVRDAARNAGIDAIGQDGCGEDALGALIGFAKARGPSGIDAAARKAAALEIKAMDAEAGK